MSSGTHCLICNKKVRLTTIRCRCNVPLCDKHVRCGEHECDFDYLREHKLKIEKQNPVIKPTLI